MFSYSCNGVNSPLSHSTVVLCIQGLHRVFHYSAILKKITFILIIQCNLIRFVPRSFCSCYLLTFSSSLATSHTTTHSLNLPLQSTQPLSHQCSPPLTTSFFLARFTVVPLPIHCYLILSYYPSLAYTTPLSLSLALTTSHHLSLPCQSSLPLTTSLSLTSPHYMYLSLSLSPSPNLTSHHYLSCVSLSLSSIHQPSLALTILVSFSLANPHCMYLSLSHSPSLNLTSHH